jgi:hypothetical protein
MVMCCLEALEHTVWKIYNMSEREEGMETKVVQVRCNERHTGFKVQQPGPREHEPPQCLGQRGQK